MKTIVFISPTGTLENGAEKSVFFLMKYLVQQGFHVVNVYPRSKRINQKRYVREMQKNHIQTESIDVLKWWWPEAPGNPYATTEEINYFYQLNLSEIKKILVREKAFLVISNSVNVFLGAIAANELKIPHYWLIHEFPENEFAYYLKYIPWIQNLSKCIFSVGGELNKNLSEKFKNKKPLSFYPYVAILEKDLKTPNSKERTIFSIGKVTKRKNQLELIQAYENIKIKNTHIKLAFIGGLDKEYYSLCKQYIKEHQLADISFLGMKEDPWQLVSRQDFCVFSSINETFGLGYVESLILGVPVIVSNNSGFTTANQLFPFGRMYELGNINDLSSQINDLIENFFEEKKAAEEFKKKMVDLYSIDKMYGSLLDKICSEDGTTDHFELTKAFSVIKINQTNPSKRHIKSMIRCKQFMRFVLSVCQR